MDAHRYHYDTVVAAIRLLDEHDEALGEPDELRDRLIELGGILRAGIDDDAALRLGDHDVSHLLPDDVE